MRISILTLSINHLDYIIDLYDSILATTAQFDWEWLVGDTGDGNTFTYLNNLKDDRIHCYLLENNNGYGKNNNFLSKHATGDLLIFLNNDTQVLPGWYQGLTECFADSKVGIVGPLILNQDGSFQSFGMGLDISIDELSYNYSLSDFDNPETTKKYYVPAVTGACMMLRRNLFDLLEGYAPIYRGGYYEDTDLCLRAQAYGYRVLVTNDAKIIHKGKGSLNISKLYWRSLLDNRRVFRKQWFNVITRLGNLKPIPYGPLYPSASVVCLDRWLITMGGGEYEMLKAAQVFANHCSNVHIYYDDPAQPNYVRELIKNRFGIILPENVALHNKLENLIKSTIIWDENYYDLSNSYQSPSCLHLKRVMFGRLDATPALGPHYLFNSRYTKECLPDIERSSIVHPPVQQTVMPGQYRSLLEAKKNLFLSVGRFAKRESFLNWKNQLALINFFHSLPETILKNHRLIMAGGVGDEDYYLKCCKGVLAGAAAQRIEILPNVERQELLSKYIESKYYLSFCGYEGDSLANNEHFGISLVEAMAAGCICCAYNAGGHTEIIDHEQDGFLWNNTSELADILSEIILGRYVCAQDRLACNALSKARQFAVPFFEMEIEYFIYARSKGMFEVIT